MASPVRADVDAGCSRPGGAWLCSIAAQGSSSPGSGQEGGTGTRRDSSVSADPACVPRENLNCLSPRETPRVSTAEAAEMAKDAIMLPLAVGEIQTSAG
jgi:hypothetical protein